jgi:hypothetical protein
MFRHFIAIPLLGPVDLDLIAISRGDRWRRGHRPSSQGPQALPVTIHNQTSRCRSVGTRRPAQDRQVVDRQFNPRRYDAAQAIQRFSARPRDQIDLDTLTSELVAVVQHRGLFMSRKRISSAQTRSASTRLHDPDQITPA